MLNKKTYFEQTPVEVVKKTAGIEVNDIEELVSAVEKAKMKKAGRTSSEGVKPSCS